jgi:hypothetical protein
MVGIVQEFSQQLTHLPPQTSTPWCAVCPSHGMGSMDPPDPTQVTSLKGVGQGQFFLDKCFNCTTTSVSDELLAHSQKWQKRHPSSMLGAQTIQIGS